MWSTNVHSVLGTELLSGHGSKRWSNRALTEERDLRSLGATASLRAQRLAQLKQLSDGDVEAIVHDVKSSQSIPRLGYHFARHGAEFEVDNPEEYVAALRRHLQRGDLRIFTFLDRTSKGLTGFWALVAPDNAATVLYNEQQRRLWSFYRPRAPAVRMANVQTLWIEVCRRGQSWEFEEQWQWQN